MKSPFTIVPTFLRQPDEFFESIGRGEAIEAKAQALALSAVVFLATFGFVTGLSHSLWQALASAVKMPVLFVTTMFFCLPAFYFFSLVFGTRLSLPQVTTVILAAIGVTSLLLLGLSPVTLFFVITSHSYSFFKLLAFFFVAISGCVGMYFLWRGITSLETSGNATNLQRPLLSLWFILYAFMGSQMTWRLSPLVGDPAQGFVLIQPSRDNFYVDVVRAAGELTGFEFLGVNAIMVGALCLLPLTALFFGLLLFGQTMNRRVKPAPREPAIAPPHSGQA